ncbi:MAG: type II and III secretion system protein family protein [Candidatus Binataceae bacterium]
MKMKRGCGLAVSIMAATGFLILSTGFAADAGNKVSVTINAGETYVINDLAKDSTPAVHVLKNPNALVVHSDKPGELVILGASAGQWAIDVQTAEGEKVSYDVSVNSLANSNPLKPGKLPPTLGSPAASANATATSPSGSLDSGSGPVAAAAGAGAMGTAAAATPGAAADGGATALPPVPTEKAAAAPSAAPAAETAAAPIAPRAAEAVAPAALASKTEVDTSAEPSSAAAAASASPLTSVTATAPAPAVIPSTEGAMPSQEASTEASQLPRERFRSDPLATRPPPSMVVNGGTNYLPNDVVSMMTGTSEIFDFPRRIRRVSIADTAIADLQVINPFQINLIGHTPGFTTLAVWDAQGNYQEREIRVDPFGKQQVLLNVIVAELDKSRMEAQGINWSAALPNYNVSLVSLAGGVATPYSPATSLTSDILLGAGSPTQTLLSTSATGTLPPGGAIIPLLLSSQMSYGLSAGNSNVQTQTFFQFLESHNLAKILAEPHILANSGEKAEFLSGGEIPIVIAQALNTSIAFKQFGTSVTFLPTVVGKDDIELEVKPEVSQPDYGHGVQMFGFTIPAFVTRRAQTWVRLKNNQTLIIAGLILHTKTSAVDKTPYLGDLPYVGMLFKHTSYNDQESDLVMTVTPQLVEALPSNGQVALPTQRPPLTAEEIRTHRLSQPDVSRPRF